MIGDSQRLSDAEQHRRLGHASARALAELMRHLHVLGQRIAGELPDQDRNGTPAE